MEDTQKRQVAHKARIAEIFEGTYVKEEGWQPNYILTKSGIRISRLNLIATVVSVQPGIPNNNLIVDDGTGTIGLRPFEEMPSLKELEIGDIINLIGKPREYGTEKYIVPEIIRKIKDEAWVKVRQKELELAESLAGKAPIPEAIPKSDAVVEEIAVEAVAPQQENSFQRIYKLIKKLDSGEGAAVDEIVKSAGLHNADEIISELLKEGEIFEIKSGRLKVLE
jgi:hypothetical protein